MGSPPAAIADQDVSDPLPELLEGLNVCMLVTNDVSRDTRVRREARALMDAGAAVTIVGVGDHSANPGGLDIRLVSSAVASNARMRLLRVAANVLSAWRFERRMLRAAKTVAADVYHCHDLDTLGAGYHAARGRRAALVYDSHELCLEDAGVADDWRYPLLVRVERRICPVANLVITVNDAIAGELARRYGISRPLVLFNGPDRCAVATPSQRPLRVFFQGSFSEGRGLPEIIEAMASLRGFVHLTLQGYGALESWLHNRVSELGLRDSVSVVPACAPEDTARDAAGYDVGVVGSTIEVLSVHLASPNKLFSYLGGGLALAVPDLPVMRGIVEEYHCGMVIDQMTPTAIAEALRWLADHPEDVARMKQGAVRACAEFSWENQAAKLVNAYAQMIKQGNHQ